MRVSVHSRRRQAAWARAGVAGALAVERAANGLATRMSKRAYRRYHRHFISSYISRCSLP
ncbi:hypothetical protein AQ611_18790 [Burkholderia singularis]|nr:hypothetical protein AQ611_18790 [Burkholderia sp. Bp7605]